MADIQDLEPAGGAGDSSSAPDPSGGRERGRPARVVRYGAMAWIGEFSCRADVVFGCGTRVVVQTERGIELGAPIGVPREGCGCDLTVPRAQLQTYLRSSGPEFCRPRAGRILRIANQQDLNEQAHLDAHIGEDIAQCAEAAARLNLDMKIITAEHLLGGERIVFYFASAGRVDFRQLVKELAQRHRTRIEMRQVGARDEARLVADFEVCGRECCCRNFLKKLRPVNMKMAKLQKSTLDPSKVSGRCGRLRCCLRYEHFGYEELAGRLPRLGSRVATDDGEATVIDRQILTQLVMVRTDDNRIFSVPLDEIRAFDLPLPPPMPPPAPPGNKTRPEPDDAARQARRRGRGRQESDRPRFAPVPNASPTGEDKPQQPPASAFVSELAPVEAGPTIDAAPLALDPAPPSADMHPPEDASPGVESAAPRPEGGPRRRRRGRRRRGGRGTSPSNDGGPGE